MILRENIRFVRVFEYTRVLLSVQGAGVSCYRYIPQGLFIGANVLARASLIRTHVLARASLIGTNVLSRASLIGTNVLARASLIGTKKWSGPGPSHQCT